MAVRLPVAADGGDYGGLLFISGYSGEISAVADWRGKCVGNWVIDMPLYEDCNSPYVYGLSLSFSCPGL